MAFVLVNNSTDPKQKTTIFFFLRNKKMQGVQFVSVPVTLAITGVYYAIKKSISAGLYSIKT